VKRFPAFDPPEYVDWRPDPALVRAFRATVEADAERAAVVAALAPEDKLALYAGLLRARLHDVQLKRWVRTGVISKAWLGTGEEATTVGPVHALERGTDIVAPMIRNAAACCECGMPVAAMLRAYLGSADSPSGDPSAGGAALPEDASRSAQARRASASVPRAAKAESDASRILLGSARCHRAGRGGESRCEPTNGDRGRRGWRWIRGR